MRRTAHQAVHLLVAASLLVPNLGAFAASDPGGPLPNADINASALLLTSPSDSGFLATESISQLGDAVENGHAVERDRAASDGVSNGGGEANTPEAEVVEIDLTKDVEGLYWAPSGGLTDGTYFYPVSATVQRESSGGFTFENGSAAAGVADEGVMRGHYGGGPGAARWILTLNFGGVGTSPGGDWMSSKAGSINDPDSNHNPWWAYNRVWYSLDGTHWPQETWTIGYPPPAYSGTWPGNLTADGSTAWTPLDRDRNCIPAGEKCQYLRLGLQEGRGIAPLKGWGAYNDVELLMDSFRILVPEVETAIPWNAMLNGYGDACFDPNAQGTAGGPINTLTGAYMWNEDDISISTPAGPLTFSRSYSSNAVEVDGDLLSPGWTHNHDTRLIFPDDPGGDPAVVYFKAHSNNRYTFYIQGDDAFLSFPGVCAQLTKEEGPPETYELVDRGQNIYRFDAEGRLTSFATASGQSLAYNYDGEGRLSRVSDHANKLIAVSDQRSAFGFAYNGLGDRLVQTVDGFSTQYTLDLNAGLTHVLADGTNAYLYGMTRIGQQGPAGWAYHLPDALGSVRQIADPAANVALVRACEPFGSQKLAAGPAASPYGFAGEWVDASGLVHLRARCYAPYLGTFLQPDPFSGYSSRPMTQNPYVYAFNNPILLTDPTGHNPAAAVAMAALVGAGVGFGMIWHRLHRMEPGW